MSSRPPRACPPTSLKRAGPGRASLSGPDARDRLPPAVLCVAWTFCGRRRVARAGFPRHRQRRKLRRGLVRTRRIRNVPRGRTGHVPVDAGVPAKRPMWATAMPGCCLPLCTVPDLPPWLTGPVAQDILRDGGDAAVARALAWMIDRAPESLEPAVDGTKKTAAFNMTVLSHLLGTPLEPNLDGHVLMLEEVGEAIYRIDRSLFHITSSAGIRRVSGIMLGRCSNITPNEPEFGMNEEQVATILVPEGRNSLAGTRRHRARHSQQDRTLRPLAMTAPGTKSDRKADPSAPPELLHRRPFLQPLPGIDLAGIKITVRVRTRRHAPNGIRRRCDPGCRTCRPPRHPNGAPLP